MNNVISHRPDTLPLTRACHVLGLNRSTVYAHQKRAANDEPPRRSRKQSTQPRALSAEERATVVETLHSEPYRDQPPAEVYQRLLEQDQYLCSVSSMHRIPHDVWTWDITKLPLLRRGIYLSLYVVLDLFSRFVVAWMVSSKENSALAKQLMDEATARYDIAPGQLTLHQDRGSPMTAHGYLNFMNELDVTCSHSRPRVSNDNPFSESQFKTQKYQPDYPGRFTDSSHARQWCGTYFDWYNVEHHHSGLARFTPEQVFTGRYREVAVQKQRILDKRYERNPERFVHGHPIVPMPPETVAIDPIAETGEDLVIDDRVNFPTLSAAGYVK